MNYREINADTIDRWVREGWEWGVPITHEDYMKAASGDWDVLLTPTKPVPHGWFCDLEGKVVLGLAAGGGQQMPVFAARGAHCTVFDISEEQLKSERLVAQREGYEIRIVKGDMTLPLPFEDASFDLVFHPVSNDYIKDAERVFKECYRVLRPGGVLLCGLSNEVNFIVNGDETMIVNRMPFDPLSVPEYMKTLQDEDCGVQFSHTVDEQLGGQLRAGFILTDLYGDVNGDGRLRELNIQTYTATRAVKPGTPG
ncbi:MAG: class I SAM-dependent methyltransferase [Clostridia bacterium]|nr:class I SAM-dependent methyltransferase [Clostridia bacterium]